MGHLSVILAQPSPRHPRAAHRPSSSLEERGSSFFTLKPWISTLRVKMTVIGRGDGVGWRGLAWAGVGWRGLAWAGAVMAR